jgi:hypothetical protein
MKEIFNSYKKESIYILIILIISIVVFKLSFFKESFLTVIRTVFSFFWLFVLPGHIIMLRWKQSLGFLERIIVGIIISLALMGTISYYFGLMGLHTKFHQVIIPVVLILLGLVLNSRK